MGVLASGSVHARPSAHPPIDTSGNISAHVSGRGLNKISDDSKHFLCFQNNNKNRPQGGRGVRQFFLSPQFLLCDLRPHSKFHNPTITPSGRKVTQAERRRKTAVNSGHLVL